MIDNLKISYDTIILHAILYIHEHASMIEHHNRKRNNILCHFLKFTKSDNGDLTIYKKWQGELWHFTKKCHIIDCKLSKYILHRNQHLFNISANKPPLFRNYQCGKCDVIEKLCWRSFNKRFYHYSISFSHHSKGLCLRFNDTAIRLVLLELRNKMDNWIRQWCKQNENPWN